MEWKPNTPNNNTAAQADSMEWCWNSGKIKNVTFSWNCKNILGKVSELRKFWKIDIFDKFSHANKGEETESISKAVDDTTNGMSPPKLELQGFNI